MQKTQELTVSREFIKHIISDIEHLIDDIEMIVDKKSAKVIEKRLKDVKSGKVKGLSEKDFNEFMRKAGVDVN